MVKLVSVNNGPLASNLIHVIGLKKTRDDGSTIISDTITIGREGTTTNIENLAVSKINGPSGAISIAGNLNVSSGGPVTVLSSFTTTTIAGFVNQQARIAYGNGKFVLIGDTSKVYHSSNGTTWTQVTSPTFPGNLRTILFVKDKFMIVSEVTPVVVHTSTDGAIWNPVTITTPTTNSVIFAASYGNDIIVGITPGTGNIYTSGIAGASWPQITLGSIKLYGVIFGTMSTATHGTNVFIVFGENIIRRNESSPAESGPWTTLTPTGADSPGTLWYHGGFGNDTFMLTSMDAVTPSNKSFLTISRDAGKTWSTPITFDITLRQPIYVEGVWYIASEDNVMMISKDNGITWEKRTTGIKSWFYAYGNGLFLNLHTSNTNTVVNLIGFKTKREDGSLITSDAITIGREGTTTTIASDSLAVSKINVGSSNTLSIASNVNVSIGNPTTLFTFTSSGIAFTVGRVAYGNGKFVIVGEANKVYHSSNGTTWTQVTSPTFPQAMRTVLYANDKFMIFSENVTNVIYTSPDGAIWNTVSVNTQPSSYMYSVAYGNNSLVGITPNTGMIHVSTSTPLGSIWSSVTIPGTLLFFVAAFGKMNNTANGTNVFIVAGRNNLIRRNEGTASGTWSEPTTYPSISGTWQFCGFGNDTFMITSSDTIGLLTISRDAGKTWSTPINFGIELAQPIYVDGDWYIASTSSGFMMISKDNGVTWEKRGSPGIKIDRFAYGNGMLVGILDNISYLIGLKKRKDDGSLITSDTITIGRDGSTLQVNRPITVGYIPSEITSPSMIGYMYDAPYIGGGNAIPNGTNIPYGTMTIATAGVWIIVGTVFYNTNTASILYQKVMINKAGGMIAEQSALNQNSSWAGATINLSAVVINTASTTYTIELFVYVAGGTVYASAGGFSFKAVRIA